MSSAKLRPENAEVERRAKRRLQRLHPKRCSPSSVLPSFVTLSELHSGHDIDVPSCTQPNRPTLLQENRLSWPPARWIRVAAFADKPAAVRW
jgi:hypothetical protein